MAYDKEFKAQAVRKFRESSESIAAVAREVGVAPSTLVRWDAQFPVQAASQELSEQEFREREGNELLERLGRNDEATRVRFAASLRRHDRRLRLFSAAKGLVEVVVLGFGSLLFLGIVLALLESETPIRGVLLVFVVVVVIISLLTTFLNWLIVKVVMLFGTFFVTAVIAEGVEQLLAKDAAQIRARKAEHNHAQEWERTLMTPRRWDVWGRYRLRSLRSNLRIAESQLGRRTVLGRAFQTGGAREWELAQRRRIAATIGYVEIILELEGARAYDRARHLLRQVSYLTLLRDWSLDDLPSLPDAAATYQSPLRRFWSRIFAPVPVLGTLVALGLAIPELANLLQSVRRP